jgi:hypothetical protein
MVAPAEQLNSPDTLCLTVTGAAGKKTLAHPGCAAPISLWFMNHHFGT